MAYEKIGYNKDTAKTLRYVHLHKDQKNPHHAELTSLDPEKAALEMNQTRELFETKGGNECLHIIQSFHPQQSKNMNVELAVEIGVKTAKTLYPGHQFHVVPHTDTRHLHTHIVVNTTSSIDGKKIQNKKRNLYELRERANEICKSFGLETLENHRPQNSKSPRLSDKTIAINKRGGHSYILDLKQKLRFALNTARTEEEYFEILRSFNISVKQTEKNLTYTYPGKTRGKRGDKIGREFTAEGIKATIGQRSLSFRQKKIASISKEAGEIKDKESINGSASQGTSHQQRKKQDSPSLNALQNSVSPAMLIKLASQMDIEAYAKNNNIALNKIDGRTTIKGKPWVEINGSTWTNVRNETTGNLIDFVFLTQKTNSYLEALSKVTKTPELLQLESVTAMDEKFRSFLMSEENSKIKALKILNKKSAVMEINRLPVSGPSPRDTEIDLIRSIEKEIKNELDPEILLPSLI